jgi:hypothetical protein
LVRANAVHPLEDRPRNAARSGQLSIKSRAAAMSAGQRASEPTKEFHVNSWRSQNDCTLIGCSPPFTGMWLARV